MTDTGTFRLSLVALIPQLRAYAISLCRNRDQADDIVQDALLKAWSNRDTLRDSSKLKPWLLAILRNEYQLARRKNLRTESGPIAGDDEAWIHAPQIASVELGQVSDALNRLSLHEREALVLIGVQEVSYEDAATVAGCPVGTMKSRVCTARKRLSALLNAPANPPVTSVAGPLKRISIASCQAHEAGSSASRAGRAPATTDELQCNEVPDQPTSTRLVTS